MKWSRRASGASAAIAAAGALVLTACGSSGSQATQSAARPREVRSSAWVTKAPMPTPRTSLAAVALDGKIYAVGGWGYVDGGQGNLDVLEVYDPAANAWTSRRPMPTARNALAAAAVNGHVYAIGGWDGAPTGKVERYDPATDTWSAASSMNSPHVGPVAAVLEGKIYVAGGDTVEVYDPGSDTWTTTESRNWKPRYLAAAGVANGRIYVFGGTDNWDPLSITALYDAVQSYDPSTDTWTDEAPMLNPRGQLAAAGVGGAIYALAGASWYQSVVFSTIVEEYDPRADRWTTDAPMNLGRLGLAAAAVSGKVYAIGGWYALDGWNGIGPTNVVEEYASPHPAIAIQGDTCIVPDSDLNPYFVTSTRVLVTQSQNGGVIVKCSAEGIWNGTGRAFLLGTRQQPDWACVILSSTWLPYTTYDWHYTLSASGSATLTCRYRP